MYDLKINDEYSGRRLDRVVKILHPNISKIIIFKLIRKKRILINKKKTSANYILENNDILSLPNFDLPDCEKTKEIIPTDKKNYKIEILFEDNDILVIDKQSGLAVQPGSGINTSLIDILNVLYDTKIYPVHRLDKETSGCIIFAKNYKSARYLSDDLHNKSIKKVYIAGILGVFPKSIQTIENSDPIISSHSLIGFFNDKDATTKIIDVECLMRTSIVLLMPVTGRKHQLRLHLSMLNYPILGDKKYGDFEINKQIKIKRLLLHADTLEFFHPITKKHTIIKSKKTINFKENIKLLDKLL